MKLFRRVISIFIVMLILVGNQIPVARSQEDTPFPIVTVSKDPANITSQTTDASPKLSSSLSQLLDVYDSSGDAAAEEFARQSGMILEDGKVQVVLVGDRNADMESIRTSLSSLGGQLESTYENFQQAMVPIETLEILRNRSDVHLIREPWRPTILDPNVGAQTTEGVAASNVDSWHSNPTVRDGTGVSVAIIDGGFNGHAALMGTDLPGTVTTQDYTGSFPGSSPHGTACAEIVHDMAPGAAMYLVMIGTDVDLANAITYLIGQGVDVISMSLGWIAGGPGDGTDGGGVTPLYSALANARSNGIFVATAAGNNRDDMWSGTYSDHPTVSNTHQWPHTGNINCIGPGSPDFTCYYIPIGNTISAALHWDSWPNGPDDYNLHLFANSGSGWVVVASSTNNQTSGAEPIESIIHVTGPPRTDTTAYGFLVERISASSNNCFRLILSHSLGAALDEQVESRTFIFPSDSPNAMSVAAVDVTTFNQELYSSEGPTFGTGGACTGGSIEPDISGYANVSTVSYGAGIFNGTSAATPHVAGAAVLYTDAYQATLGGGMPPTPSQTQSYLETNSTNLGAPGKDNETGFGRLTLGGLSPTALTLQRFSVQSNQSIYLAAIAGIFVMALGAVLMLIRRRSN